MNVTGGIRLDEPATDLALALAVASSFRDRPLPPDLVAIGEVGLGGELRPVSQAERRVAEARRLGFRRAILPKRSASAEGRGAAGGDKGAATEKGVLSAATLSEAIALAFGVREAP